MTSTPGPLTRLTQAVAAGFTATRAVATSLARLEGSPLNAAIDLAADEALARAAAIDRGEVAPGPLLGAPTLVKDLEDWAGHPTRKGSLTLADAPPAVANAVVPQRLLDAGAILVGKSTLPEFAIEGYTANRLTGVTRNPWNLDYSPGGSSGGSAAALAAGLVLVATATDGGGSVRIPASLCGLVGLKPTNGAIGRYPAPDWIDYSTDGPFATASDDLALLFDVMAGPVAGDPTGPPRGALDAAPGLDHPRTLYAATRTSPLGPLPREVESAFITAVDALADLLGRPVHWREPDEFFTGVGDPDLDWFTVTAAEHVSALGRAWVIEHDDLFHVATREFLAGGLATSLDEYLAARRRRYLYVRRLDELLGVDGWLLTPTVASAGWLADGRLTPGGEVHGLPPEVYSTALQNITGHPALTLPFGHLSTGLPFGLQVTAPHYHDRALLALAAHVEAAYPWARSAPGYDTLADALGLD